MKPRKRFSVHVQRHPEANFGGGEWWRIHETDDIAEARQFISARQNNGEKYRIYSGSIIVNR